MYILVKNDAEFIQADPCKGKVDMPIGYPCLFVVVYGLDTDEIKRGAIPVPGYRYRFIYIPPKVKNLDSFVEGVNAVC
jgi:hypothetical protein